MICRSSKPSKDKGKETSKKIILLVGPDKLSFSYEECSKECVYVYILCERSTVEFTQDLLTNPILSEIGVLAFS